MIVFFGRDLSVVMLFCDVAAHTCELFVGNWYVSIYTVHDEVKDKAFILDLSWVGECQ